MSQTTKLYISKRYNLRDVKQVMENHLDLKEQTCIKKNIKEEDYIEKFKIKIRSTGDIGFNYFEFIYNGKNRSMGVFDSTDLCIKGLSELHLGYNDDSIKIMETIANVLGGLLEENDCGNQGIREIQGMLRESDGLPFFLKEAIMNNKLKDNEDIKGLNEYIHSWCDKISNQAELRKKLFDKEGEQNDK